MQRFATKRMTNRLPMVDPALSAFRRLASPSSRLLPAAHCGFTLVEVMVAATITLLLMGGVVTMFGYVTSKVTNSRAVVELTDQLRHAKQRLQLDLQGATAPTIPPLKPESEQGYFEIIEGPLGPVIVPDYSVGDNDDVLMFTSRGLKEEFTGRAAPGVKNISAGLMRSPLAEVCWFLRNSTLYRRVLLIRPTLTIGNVSNYYANYDVSMRQENGPYDHRAVPKGTFAGPAGGAYPLIVCNTLGDLTKRENRYGHQPLAWPYDARFWNRPIQSASSVAPASRPGFGLPILYESGHAYWPFPYYGPPARNAAGASYVKFFHDPNRASDPLAGPYIIPSGTGTANGSFASVVAGALPLHGASNTSGYSGWTTNSFLYKGTASSDTIPGFSYGRYDDIVMKHVVSFDIKVWDPGAPVFQVQSSSAGTLGPYTAVLPGDAGYSATLQRFIRNPSPTNQLETLSSLGAYVDLNYMYASSNANNWPNALAKYCRTLYGSQNAVVNPTGVTTGSLAFSYYYRSNHVGIPGVTQLLPLPWFHLPPNPQSGIVAIPTNTSTNYNFGAPAGSIWDTWSTHYERDGIDNDLDGLIDEATDGVDNSNNRIRNGANVLIPYNNYGVDDPSELEAPPPYRYPLRGIEIKIRAYESDTKQVREVTVVHEFLQE